MIHKMMWVKILILLSPFVSWCLLIILSFFRCQNLVMFFLPAVFSSMFFIYVARQEKLQNNILCLLMLLHHLVFLPFFLIRHAPVGSLLFPLLLIWCSSFLGYALWLDNECHREHNTLTLKKRIFLFISPFIEWGIWCCFVAVAWESMGTQYNTKPGILFCGSIRLLGTILWIFPLFCTYLFWTIIRIEGWKHNGLCLLAIVGQFLCFSLFLRPSFYIPVPVIMWYLAIVFYTFWLEYHYMKTFRSN